MTEVMPIERQQVDRDRLDPVGQVKVPGVEIPVKDELTGSGCRIFHAASAGNPGDEGVRVLHVDTTGFVIGQNQEKHAALCAGRLRVRDG